MVGSLLENVYIPPMMTVKQHFPAEKIENIEKFTINQLSQQKIASLVKPGMKIAVGVGSRGISNYAAIVKIVVDFIKQQGASPFIVSAMGSHGGATASGQQEVLKGYGITEEYMGCPLKISMKTKIIAHTEEGYPVQIDNDAAEADGIVIVNRIKPHTAFRGPWESGLMKMLAIGIAKQSGAEFCHAKGFKNMAEMVPLFGKAIIKNANILFGVALLENAYERTADIVALTSEEITTKEPELLERAKKMMPRILIDTADVLVVDEIGKNISGDGMDPNISGTFATPYAQGGISTQRVAVLDITDESHGNGVGWGMADCSTKRALNKFDREMSYPNALTCLVTQVVKFPMVFETDKQCIQAAIKTCADADFENIRVVRIKNTLSMDEIQVSVSLRQKVLATEGMEIIKEAEDLPFNASKNLF